MLAKDIKVDQEYCVVRNDSQQFRRPGGFSIASIRNSALRAKVIATKFPRRVTAPEGWHSWTRGDGIRVRIEEVPETNLMDTSFHRKQITVIARCVLMPWSEYETLLAEYKQSEAERDAELRRGEAEREAERQEKWERERKQDIANILAAANQAPGSVTIAPSLFQSTVEFVYNRLHPKEDHDA